MTTVQVTKEAPKFWNQRQTLYVSILCISSAIIIATVISVALLKEKPNSRSLNKEVTIELPSLSQQNLQVLYDQQLKVDLKKELADTVNDMVAAVIKTTHGQLSHIKNILVSQNVSYAIAQ